MKQLLIISGMVLFSVGSCIEHGQKADREIAKDAEEGEKTVQDTDKTTAGDKWERLVMVPFKDNKGQVIVEMPFPSSWKMHGKVSSGEPHITGPKGTKVIDYPM